jgi:hypothetical protein
MTALVLILRRVALPSDQAQSRKPMCLSPISDHCTSAIDMQYQGRDHRIDPRAPEEKQMATALSRILDHLRDDGGLQGKDIANMSRYRRLRFRAGRTARRRRIFARKR